MKIFIQIFFYLAVVKGYTQNINITYVIDKGAKDFHGQHTKHTYEAALSILGDESFYKPVGEFKEKEEISLLYNEKDKETGYTYTSNIWQTIQNTYIEYYFNHKKKEQISLIRKEKAYLIKEPLEPIHWKITTTKKLLENYVCTKAIGKIENHFVVAWFAPKITTMAGPEGYHGLPGLILMIEKPDQSTIRMKSIVFDSIKAKKLTPPSKGVLIERAAFETIQKEQDEKQAIQDATNFFND